MIYADFNGSSPLCESVVEHLNKRLSEAEYANPNASHYLGQKTLMNMENSRAVCSKALGCKPKQLIFNSGSTEGLSTIFHSVLRKSVTEQKNKLIVSSIEHAAIYNLADYYSTIGIETLMVKTLPSGLIDLEDLAQLLENNKDQLAMVSIMAANNETGVIQPYKEISKLCASFQVPFSCDSTQLIGKGPFSFEESGADYAVVSGHKIGALVGSGLLIAKDPSTITPLIIGGGQEKGLRGGTQNYIGNETLSVAFLETQKKLEKVEMLEAKRDEFEAKLKDEFKDMIFLGKEAPRLATTTFLSLPGVTGRCVQEALEDEGIYVTTSSACCDGKSTISKVLQAMNVTEEIGKGAVRISLGLCATEECYNHLYEKVAAIFRKLATN